MDFGLTNLTDGNFSFWSTTGIVTLTLVLIQLFAANTFTNCADTGATRQILHSMVHANWFHLLVNMFTFLQLYDLEVQLGSRNYFILIAIILVLSSLLYWLINKVLYGGKVVCSIGFSGVLFGLLVWSRMMVNGGGFNLKEIALWATILIVPALQDPQISVLGHLSGLIVGLLLWPILSPILLKI